MHIGNYLGLVHKSEQDLAEAFKKVATQHIDEPDILQMCMKLASWSENHLPNIQKFVSRYAEEKSKEPDQLKKELFDKNVVIKSRKNRML